MMFNTPFGGYGFTWFFKWAPKAKRKFPDDCIVSLCDYEILSAKGTPLIEMDTESTGGNLARAAGQWYIRRGNNIQEGEASELLTDVIDLPKVPKVGTGDLLVLYQRGQEGFEWHFLVFAGRRSSILKSKVYDRTELSRAFSLVEIVPCTILKEEVCVYLTHACFE